MAIRQRMVEPSWPRCVEPVAQQPSVDVALLPACRVAREHHHNATELSETGGEGARLGMDSLADPAPQGDDMVTPRNPSDLGSLRPPGWTFADLPDEELLTYADGECACVTRERAGTRHGFTCPAHRASAELERRRHARERRCESWCRGTPGHFGDCIPGAR